jgi:hypothetical protein
LKELNEIIKQLTDDTEERRKVASAKNENYKVEFSEGEKMLMQISPKQSKGFWINYKSLNF